MKDVKQQKEIIMFIYGNSNKELDMNLEPTTTAILIGLAIKALEGFAEEFGKGLGKTLGEGIGKAILGFLGLNGDYDISKAELEALLRQYSDYIINEISLKIDKSRLDIENENLQTYSTTLIEYINAKEGNDFKLYQLESDVLKCFNQLLQLSSTSLRGTVIYSLMTCSLLRVSIYSEKISLFKDKDIDPKSELENFRIALVQINSILNSKVMQIQEDFDKQVIGPNETTTQITCEEDVLVDPDTGRTVKEYYSRTVKAIESIVDGQRYIGETEWCNLSSDEGQKVIDFTVNTREKYKKTFETQIANPFTQFNTSITKLITNIEAINL